MSILHQHAVRTPLPDENAERLFHENMMAIADGRERKARLLLDPDVPVRQAYEEEVARVAESFRRRLSSTVGEDYEAVARAYHRGERSDRLGELAAYYIEGLWRIQQRSTVTDMLFFPIILRYPDSFTVNIRFTGDHSTTESIRYESPEHGRPELPEGHARQYYGESWYEQQRAAAYLLETAQVIREVFPAPEVSSFTERKYGGIVSAGGRRGAEFTVMLKRVEPEPARFAELVDAPVLVPEGEEARRTASELLPAGESVR